MDLRSADLALRNAKPKGMSYELALGDGISARVAADGITKTLYWRGKKDRRVIRVKLGNYPDMTLRQAADAALKVHSSIRNGVDPNLKARRTAAGADAPIIVREAVERFENEHLGAKAGARWRTEAARILKVDVLPTLGRYRLADVRRTDLTSLVDKKAAALRKRERAGVGANRLVSLLGRFFRFCADKGWIEANPALRLPKPVVEIKRERVLSKGELGAVWIALQDAAAGDGAMPEVYARVLLLLMVTGCRASEVTALRLRNVDLDAGTIEIAAGKTKSSKRSLPFGPAARSIIVDAIFALSQGAKSDALLFPMPIAEGTIGAADISKAARRLVVDLSHKRWTPHDFRRTLVTQMHEEGVDGDIVRRIAGHVGADVHATVYDRSPQTAKMRDALAEYEEFILGCAAELQKVSESNVVPLRTSRV